jgi:hypothetical protein
MVRSVQADLRSVVVRNLKHCYNQYAESKKRCRGICIDDGLFSSQYVTLSSKEPTRIQMKKELYFNDGDNSIRLFFRVRSLLKQVLPLSLNLSLELLHGLVNVPFRIL